jgi:hypothetical protein
VGGRVFFVLGWKFSMWFVELFGRKYVGNFHLNFLGWEIFSCFVGNFPSYFRFNCWWLEYWLRENLNLLVNRCEKYSEVFIDKITV